MKVKFDKAVGDYTGRSRKFQACGDENTNEVFVDKAYVAIDQFILSPTMGVKNARGAFATEMSGQREWIVKLRPEHADSGCDDTEDWQHADLRLVRVDPPKGRKFYGADPAAPRPTGAH